MTQAARNTYLETQLMTATPQQLRLMLIDGAIRFANATLGQWEQDNNDAAFESIVRCRSIISELLMTIKAEQNELAQKVAAIYLFLFQHITEAQLHRDIDKLNQVLRVLEEERETWREVCEKHPHGVAPGMAAASVRKEITTRNMAGDQAAQQTPPQQIPAAAAPAAVSASAASTSAATYSAPSGGFSFEA